MNEPCSPFGADADRPLRQLALVKDGHRYLFGYEAGQEVAVLDELARLAGDPTSAFSWFDAAVLSHQMGQRIGHVVDELLHP